MSTLSALVGACRRLSALVGSFAAAAEEVGCTPSAVSPQIKQLKARFGRSLFPARQISLARRSADVDSRSIDALLQPFGSAYGPAGGRQAPTA